MAQALAPYPARLGIDYPDRPLDRLTTFFRLIVAIPILIVVIAVTSRFTSASVASGGVVMLGPLLMILFREKYPRWWFDWNLALTRFQYRISTYLSLLRDEYPSTDEEQAVHLELDYPDVPRDLNRWLPLIKWLLAIPHYIALLFLSIVAMVVIIVAWFTILFTGRYPRDLFDFVVGVQRWGLRVQAYVMLLTTDRYPPFRLGR
jgi:hypothetical protein